VYLLAGNAFRTQGTRVLEVASVMGYGHQKAFLKIALPMARPWIVSGLMLVLMETLADFGAVSIFNYCGCSGRRLRRASDTDVKSRTKANCFET
jgi:iron(III) transport system permease protein